MIPPIILSHIDSFSQLKKLMNEDKMLYVLMFTASWCSPCVKIKEKIYNKTTECILSEFENVTFFYIDIEKNQILTDEMGLSSVPHFLFYKKDEKSNDDKIMASVSGGNYTTLRNTIVSLL